MNKTLPVNEIVKSVSDTHALNCEKLYAINTSDVESGKLLNPPLLNIEDLKGQFKKTIKKGDILFSEIRPANKHFARVEVDAPEDYVASTKLMVLRKFNDNVDEDYFYYWLTNTPFLNVLQRRAENRICSFPQITFELLSEYMVPVPLLEEQKKIANLIKTIDAIIANNNAISSDLEAMAKQLYDYWFVQFDFPDENGKPYRSSGGKMVWNEELKREIPEGWETKTIGDCTEHICTGLNPRKNFVLGNGNIKYVTTKNLTEQGYIDYSGCDLIDEKAKAIVHNRSKIEVGDILMGSIAPIGRCHMIMDKPLDWDINESVFSIRPNERISSEYLFQFLKSEEFIKGASNSSVGSIFKGIRIETLNNTLIVVPDKIIKEAFSLKVKDLYQKIDKTNKENEELKKLRDFLLPMLMNGQVKIKEA